MSPGPVAVQSGANIERATRVNIRQLDTGNATRSLLMVDGMRVPGQGNGTCEIDPSIIPATSLDHIDILVDGASATYGSDAIAASSISSSGAARTGRSRSCATATRGRKNALYGLPTWGRTGRW